MFSQLGRLAFPPSVLIGRTQDTTSVRGFCAGAGAFILRAHSQPVGSAHTGKALGALSSPRPAPVQSRGSQPQEQRLCLKDFLQLKNKTKPPGPRGAHCSGGRMGSPRPEALMVPKGSLGVSPSLPPSGQGQLARRPRGLSLWQMTYERTL